MTYSIPRCRRHLDMQYCLSLRAALKGRMKRPGPQILLSPHGKGYRLVLLAVSYHYLSAGKIRCTIISQELCTDALSTGTLPPYGDFRGVPAKGIDIFLYPMERKPLISKTQIRRPTFQGLSPTEMSQPDKRYWMLIPIIGFPILTLLSMTKLKLYLLSLVPPINIPPPCIHTATGRDDEFEVLLQGRKILRYKQSSDILRPLLSHPYPTQKGGHSFAE